MKPALFIVFFIGLIATSTAECEGDGCSNKRFSLPSISDSISSFLGYFQGDTDTVTSTTTKRPRLTPKTLPPFEIEPDEEIIVSPTFVTTKRPRLTPKTLPPFEIEPDEEIIVSPTYTTKKTPRPSKNTNRPTQATALPPTTTSLPYDVEDVCLVKKCYDQPDFKSEVCGTNNRTYRNLKILKCVKTQCNPKADFLKWGSCNAVTTTTTPEPEEGVVLIADDSDDEPPKTGRVDYECWKKCPRLNTHSPVCGSDNTDYNNESLLSCTNQCGKPVTLVRQGRC